MIDTTAYEVVEQDSPRVQMSWRQLQVCMQPRDTNVSDQMPQECYRHCVSLYLFCPRSTASSVGRSSRTLTPAMWATPLILLPCAPSVQVRSHRNSNLSALVLTRLIGTATLLLLCIRARHLQRGLSLHSEAQAGRVHRGQDDGEFMVVMTRLFNTGWTGLCIPVSACGCVCTQSMVSRCPACKIDVIGNPSVALREHMQTCLKVICHCKFGCGVSPESRSRAM